MVTLRLYWKIQLTNKIVLVTLLWQEKQKLSLGELKN